MTELLVVVHLVATSYMAGLIWMVQRVHYPMMGRVGQTFDDCQQMHVSRMGLLAGLPMLTELGSGLMLIWLLPGEPVWWAGLALLVCIWVSTFGFQVPLHNRLACGFDAEVHASLVRTNWIRTVLWSIRVVLVAWASIK